MSAREIHDMINCMKLEPTERGISGIADILQAITEKLEELEKTDESLQTNLQYIHNFHMNP